MAQVADYATYPIHAIDQQEVLRFMLSWIMNFEAILDPQKLKTSLEALLDIDDWKKLGARLRFKKGTNQLEAYVPTTFTHNEPAILFQHTDHSEVEIASHSLQRFFIRPRDQPFTHQVDDSREGLLPLHFPRNIKELIDRGCPQISLHVITFKDATMVILTYPHLMDAPGFMAMLRNWSRVLANKSSEVEPLIGAKEDVLERICASAREKSILEKRKMGALALPLFLQRWLRRRLTRPNMEWKMIYLPAHIKARIVSEARAAIPMQDGKKNSVSDTDIMLAWFTKLMALGESKPTPMIAMTGINPRQLLPELKQSSGVYLQCMMLPIFNIFSADQAAAALGEMALLCRQQTEEYSTEQQVLAHLKTSIEQTKTGKSGMFFCGDSRGIPFMFNNLATLDLEKVNFEHAVVSQTTGEGTPKADESHSAGVVLSTYSIRTEKDDDKLPVVNALGLDHAGNSYFTGIMWPQEWAKIDEELSRLHGAVR